MFAQLTKDELELIETTLPDGPVRNMVRGKVAALLYQGDQARRDWDRYCPMFNLTPADFGKTFHLKNQRFEVTGINPGAPRFPINAKRADGKLFRVPASAVK